MKKKSLVGFVQLQLLHWMILYSLNENITALVEKLRDWVRQDEQRRNGKNVALSPNTKQDVEIILKNGTEKDRYGFEWVVEIVHDTIN